MKLTFVFLLILYDLYIGNTLFRKKKRGVTFRILHGVACLCFVAILASIYIVKAAT